MSVSKTFAIQLRVLASLLALLIFSGVAQAAFEDDYLTSGPIIVRNITIIDGLGNAPVAGQDILIEDGKIAAIADTGTVQVPDGAIEVDGNGLTAMPGLIELHFHLKGGWSGGNAMQEKYPPASLLEHKAIQQNLAAMLYAGVTTGLDMGSTHSFIVNEKAKIDAGEYISPRYHIVGAPFSQAPSGWDGAVRAETVGEPPLDALATKVDTDDEDVIADILKRYKDDGITTIKLYSGIGAHAATILIKEAKKQGITTIADLWKLNMSSDWMRTTDLDGWAHATPNRVSDDGMQWMVDNEKFVVPTLAIGEAMAGLRVADEQGSEVMFTNPLILDIWGEEVIKDFYISYVLVREDLYEGPDSFYQQNNFGDLSQFRSSFIENVSRAYAAGVLMACGTDSPAYPTLWAGETLHREMELFAMAGIDPVNIIKICTYNAAKILKDEDKYGSLQEGLGADILIVSGDPANNISDTRNVEHVIVRGGLLNREKLLTSWQ
jgi:imidazolonepropionase-like amidohydrolase